MSISTSWDFLQERYDKGVILTDLFCSHLKLVVVEKLSPKQEGEFGVIFLFLFGHLLKLRSISGDKISQLVNYVL